jgi:hypothetical protein
MIIEDHAAVIHFGGGWGNWGYSTVSRPDEHQLELIPGLWYWSDYPLPRDPSKTSYHIVSFALAGGGLVVLIGAIVVAVHAWRKPDA